MATVSLAIMAHPSRRAFVETLQPKLPGAELVWDTKNDRWDTGARALLAYDPAATHHCVVQDDAVLCQDFAAGLGAVASAAGDHPVGLYLGRVRPFAHTMLPAMERALREDFAWIEAAGPYWGVALIIPTEHIDRIVRWGDENRGIQNYDRRISRWYDLVGISCWYTVPSIVDHRRVDENPSLIPGRNGDRRAQKFIGQDVSLLDINWNRPPLTIGDLMGPKATHTLQAPDSPEAERLVAKHDLIGYDRMNVRRRVRAGRNVPRGLLVRPEDIVDGGARVREQIEQPPTPVEGVRTSPAMRGWSPNDPMAKLSAEARKRGLSVIGTGVRGSVKKDDVVKALEEDEQ